MRDVVGVRRRMRSTWLGRSDAEQVAKTIIELAQRGVRNPSFSSGALLSRYGWTTVNAVVFPVILIAAFFLAWGSLLRRPEPV